MAAGGAGTARSLQRRRPKLIPTAVLYQSWRIRCCTLDEFAQWVQAAYLEQARTNKNKRSPLTREAFCGDGVIEACQECRDEGLCVAHKEAVCS